MATTWGGPAPFLAMVGSAYRRLLFSGRSTFLAGPDGPGGSARPGRLSALARSSQLVAVDHQTCQWFDALCHLHRHPGDSRTGTCTGADTLWRPVARYRCDLYARRALRLLRCTESWRLKHAWQRAAVAAGGMLAESIVATLAGMVWLITTDGTVNTLALQTMVVCSISTWLVNANPLMRFDGYYILSDWCDEPNLRHRADQCAMRLIKRLVLGRGSDKSIMDRRRAAALCLFSILGFAYRLSLSWMMASVIVAMYAAWHFETVGKWLALALLVCWWGVPAMKLLSQLGRSAHTVWAKARLSLLAAWSVLMICVVPIPSREYGQGWIQPARMQGLYAPQNARLEHVWKLTGSQVEQQEPIFQLDDDAAQLRKIDLERHAARARTQLVSLVEQVKRNAPVDADLTSAENAANALALQTQHAQTAANKLTIKAEMAGKLVSLPAPKSPDIDGHALDTTPALWLDRDQCGRIVPQGTMVAAICSRQQLAVIPLSDSQLSQVAQGTSVRFYIPSHSDRVWTGNVHAVVKLNQLDTLARLLSASAPQSETDSQAFGQAKKNDAVYAAIVELPMQDAAMGAEVRAVFTAPAKTLATRGNDWAHKNLRWLIP